MKTLLLAAALSLAASPALAQAVCGPRAELAEKLAAEFGERPVARGLATDGRMVEVFAGPEGSWTLVVTTPAGRACLAAAGEAWQPVEPALRGRES